jgi:hypothetical protein
MSLVRAVRSEVAELLFLGLKGRLNVKFNSTRREHKTNSFYSFQSLTRNYTYKYTFCSVPPTTQSITQVLISPLEDNLPCFHLERETRRTIKQHSWLPKRHHDTIPSHTILDSSRLDHGPHDMLDYPFP